MPSITRAAKRMFTRMENSLRRDPVLMRSELAGGSAPPVRTERDHRPCRRGGCGLSDREEGRSIATRSRTEELQGVVTVVDEEDAVTARCKSEAEEIAAGTGRI